MSIKTENKLFAQAIEICDKHDAEFEERFDGALIVLVDRVGKNRYERLRHPLFGELVRAFPVSNKDSKGRSLGVSDSSVPCGSRRNKKIFVLKLR